MKIYRKHLSEIFIGNNLSITDIALRNWDLSIIGISQGFFEIIDYRYRFNTERFIVLITVGDMLSRKIFQILHGVMAFLVLFEQILIKLFASHSESVTKYDAFCSHIFDLCMLSLFQTRSGSRKFWWGWGCNFELGWMFTIVNAKTVVDAEKSVNKPFENVLCPRRNQKLF